jgi:hypothetical protein
MNKKIQKLRTLIREYVKRELIKEDTSFKKTQLLLKQIGMIANRGSLPSRGQMQRLINVAKEEGAAIMANPSTSAGTKSLNTIKQQLSALASMGVDIELIRQVWRGAATGDSTNNVKDDELGL